MKHFSFLIFVLSLISIMVISCSGGGTIPTSPGTNPDLTAGLNSRGTNASGNTQLWGYYDVFIDIEKMEATAILNRTAMFTANCVNILNGTMNSGVYLEIYNVDNQADYLGLNLKISLRHPFPGLDHFAGYDVRGVFMGNGSGTMNYNPALKYPVAGIDQSFEPDPSDPDGSNGHPDGYTRWFNFSEFQGPGMKLFTYTKGNLSPAAFEGTATLCPYKYFADNLATNEPVADWLENNPGKHGVFSAGAVNSRDYRLRFPKSMPVIFGYAVVANWSGPDIHPSNAPEAVACRMEQTEAPYYLDSSNWGGNI
ncbi:MAG TPA: hypothetical protein ENN67_00570, partial [Firmicutes bacterium]|nr:hypothetical protein [Bacillota bacterium]